MNKTKQEEDFTREVPTISTILQLFRLFLPRNTKTIARLDKFMDLNIEKINKLKEINLKGLIIDSDDCISYNHGEILEENVTHIKRLHDQGIKLVIYSNMRKTERYEAIESYAKVLTRIPPKPGIKGFEKALQTLNLPAKNVAMVGDNYLTDAGAIRLGISFIKIKPIDIPSENRVFNLAVTLYGYLRGFYDKISRIHDKLRRKKPLKSKDLK